MDIDMVNELTRVVYTFWVIFSFSFLVALTGAMSPGPLLTYTIIKSAQANTRGYLMGLWIITGHAIIEAVIIVCLLLGFSFMFKNILVVRTIGILGGVILFYFGASIVRNVYRGSPSISFLNSPDGKNQRLPASGNRALENPVLGGMMVSMSNPYWWIWWVTIGLAFITQFDISFRNWLNLAAFFLGHEAGDIVWYLIVSILSFFGLRYMNMRAYHGILIFCGIFMILFGIYLGISPFLQGRIGSF